MRRGEGKDVTKYVEIRVAQLKEDMDKAHDQHDKKKRHHLAEP